MASSQPLSEEDSAGILSKILFSWVNPLFVAGNRKDKSLQQSDLLRLTRGDDPALVSAEFERRLDDFVAAGHPAPVTAAIFAQWRAPMIAAGFAKLLNSTLNFVPPILLNNLLKWLSSYAAGTAPDNYAGWLWSVGLFLALSVRTLTENSYFHRVVRVGFQIRTAVTAAVYRKALRLSPISRLETPVGQIVNLMQLDATRLDTMCMQFRELIVDGRAGSGAVSSARNARIGT